MEAKISVVDVSLVVNLSFRPDPNTMCRLEYAAFVFHDGLTDMCGFCSR